MITSVAPVDVARALAPEVSQRAQESESLRTLPWDLVARIRDAGLFGMALPRSLGGLELTPMEIVETVEELSRADGSTGWTVLVGNSTAFLGWLEPSVAAELLAERAAPIGSAVFAPTG